MTTPTGGALNTDFELMGSVAGTIDARNVMRMRAVDALGLEDPILVGHYEGDRLRFAGKVGSGFTARTRKDLRVALDPESNSLAALLLHLGGSLRSRWTDFLATDGEKDDRDRDAEFEPAADATREQLLARWEDGWSRFFATLAGLTVDDLTRTVTIRAEPHTVVQAIDRSLTHAAYHVGQIVFLAKHLSGDAWRTLSVPRGGTRAFNAEMFGKAR